ncbi:hypothetical protein EIP91_007121 [Steccherinum ochraceum]|uniref:Uncharacterized protein n=1 Tax=Steccherinum ochraceum TaxID=92696 RepID=A0A4R0R787_9APHY|nr:hypothetical protein EIP91_007121 [Steccherinum ochraceum]
MAAMTLLVSETPWSDLFTVATDFAGTLTYKDAKVAACSNDGKYIITTPNALTVPEPIIGLIEVRRRSDGKFGDHDPLVHPQLFCPHMPWLAAIPLRPDDELDPISIMWREVAERDFVTTIQASGLGMLLASFRALLKKPMLALLDRINELRCCPSLSSTVLSELTHYSTRAYQALERLEHVATLRDVVCKTTCVQRYYLYLVAFCTWHVDMASQEAQLMSPADQLRFKPQFMGAYTTREDHVQVLYRRGLPVWFLQLREHISKTQILIEPLTNRSLPPTDQDPKKKGPIRIHSINPANVTKIFSGYAGSDHIAAIFNHSHISSDVELVPFPESLQPIQRTRSALQSAALVSPMSAEAPLPDMAAQSPSATPASGSTVMAVRSQKIKPRSIPYAKNRKKKGFKLKDAETQRNSTVPATQHEWMPPSLGPWQEALKSLADEPPRPPSAWRFWIPEPALLLSPTNPERLQRYVENWVRIRAPWLYVQGQHHIHLEGVALSGQQWRELLNVSELNNSAVATASHSQARRVDILTVLAGTCEIEDLGRFLSSPPMWFGTPFTHTCKQQCQEVVWELFELGFRAELYQLDRFLRPPPTGALEATNFEADRQRRIAAVFQDGNLLDSHSLPPARIGLGALSVEDRVESLEALRLLMADWPDSKAVRQIGTMTSKHAEAELKVMESEVARFYVVTFFRCALRRPIVPHSFPT